MKKKILTILLSIFMVLGTFSNVVHAETKTISELLSMAADDFPTSLETAWVDGQGSSLYVSNNKLCVQLVGEQNPIEVAELTTVAEYSWAWGVELQGGDVQLTFYLEDSTSGELYSIYYYQADPYIDIGFGPSMTVEEFFGDSLNNFPHNFNDAWTNYYGIYVYVTDDKFGAYDSNNQLLDYVSLDFKTTNVADYLYTTNGGYFDIGFDLEGNIESVCFAPSIGGIDTYYIYSRNKVREILPKNYPSEYSPWTNDNGMMLMISNLDDLYCPFYITDYESIDEQFYTSVHDMELTSGSNVYTSNLVGSNSEDNVTFTFNLGSNGLTESITIDGFTNDYASMNGTYVTPSPVHVSDIIAQTIGTFPTTKEKAWDDGFMNYVYASNGKLIFNLVHTPTDYVLLSKEAEIVGGDMSSKVYHLITNNGIDINLETMYGQLRSISYGDFIVFYPMTLYDTLVNFPYDNDYPPINYWKNENDAKLCMTSTNPSFNFSNGDGSLSFTSYSLSEELPIERVLNKENTYIAHDFVRSTNEFGECVPTEDEITYTLITNDYNELIKVKMTVTGEYSSLSGTYVLPKTIEDVLETSEYVFPTSIDRQWKKGEKGLYLNGSEVYLDTTSILDTTVAAKFDGSNYFYTHPSNGYTVTFNMSNEILKSINISGGTGAFADANGTYLPPDPVVYDVIEGKNIVIDVNNYEGLVTFRSDAEYSKFYDGFELIGKVLIDGKFVHIIFYSWEEGSTKINLDVYYLSSLSNGSHTIKIVSDDGYAEASFTITGSYDPPSGPTPTPNSETTTYTVPKTGVEGITSNNYSLFKLSSLSLFAVGVYMALKKER